MNKILIRKHIRSLAAKLGVLRPLRRIVFRMRGSSHIQTETAFHQRFIRPGHLVFDVGANRGQSSEIYIGLGAKVIAFEPQTDLHKEIEQVCGHSHNLTIVPVGLGKIEETRTFYLSPYDQVASLREDWVSDPSGVATIQISTLDLQIARHGMPVYCKIDVEGWELEVLQGLSSPIPIISFEYHNTPGEIEKAHAVLSRLSSLGAYFCNLRESYRPDMLLEEFIPLTEFVGRFPCDLTLSPNGFGDIFCVTDPSSFDCGKER